ncbi:MAG: hypothetical protein HYV68_00790 [Candidatus Taylorbacteria bacterium]|nr:hypothetical protein [Candidatus Taylorbacteria bacterium]
MPKFENNFSQPWEPERKRSAEKVDPLLAKLWRENNFFGESPVKNSPVEKRLRNLCEQYAATVSRTFGFTPERERNRRDLHNQLSLMLTGKQRDTLDCVEAEKIGNFAFILYKGHSMDDMRFS